MQIPNARTPTYPHDDPGGATQAFEGKYDISRVSTSGSWSMVAVLVAMALVARSQSGRDPNYGR